MYHNSILHRYSLCVLLILFFNSLIFSQTPVSIQLVDYTSNTPIIGATFHYAAQKGTSDVEGFIEFEYQSGVTMSLSHLTFGQRQLSDKEILGAIEQKKLLWREATVNLYPATVIALHLKSKEAESLEFDYQDKMAHDGGAILSQIPAISMIRKSGNYGFDPVMRGFKYDQLNIVFNGSQSATAACPNRMDPPTSQMAPNMMDRVEILKGPHALRFGNSFGGTINFIPAAPRFSDNFNTYGRLSGRYDSNGDLFHTEGLLGFNGQNYDLSLFTSWAEGNDYEDGENRSVPGDFLRGSFGTKVHLKLSEQQQLGFSATRNLARDADFPALAMDLREDDTWMFNAEHRINFESPHLSSWTTSAYGSFVDHLMDNLLKHLDPRMLNAATYAKTKTYGGRTESDWRFNQQQLYLGADLRVEEAEGTRERNFLLGPNTGKTFFDNAWQHGRISKTGLFAEYHLPKNSWRFIFSGRLELNSADILDPAEAFTQVYPDIQQTNINPGISIGGIKNFPSNIAVGLWLGRTQRSGSLTERYINYFSVGQDPYELLGNPELSPEVNNQVDLSFEFKSQKGVVKVDVFAAYLQDYISSVIDTILSPRLPTSPGVRQYVNIDNAFKTGFEILWQQKLFAGLQHTLSMAYTYGQDLEREEPLPEIAPLDLRYTLTGNYLNNKLHPEISFRHVIKQDRTSIEYGETSTPSFSLLDVQLKYQITDFLSLSTGVQNLFDETYYEHLNRSVRGTSPSPIYAPGRNYFFALNLDFM